MLPQDGPTMKQVYDQHFTGQAMPKHNDDEDSDETQKENKTDASLTDVSIVRRPPPADYKLSGYTREADNEINQLFPRLSNPTLVIYIYPHLSGSERHPVPGYSSAFTLYEKVEYALPGEPEERY
jgi:conjugative transfer region lipoprotein (TIGR03751 family)